MTHPPFLNRRQHPYSALRGGAQLIPSPQEREALTGVLAGQTVRNDTSEDTDFTLCDQVNDLLI